MNELNVSVLVNVLCGVQFYATFEQMCILLYNHSQVVTFLDGAFQ